jgi:hypothetical protein
VIDIKYYLLTGLMVILIIGCSNNPTKSIEKPVVTQEPVVVTSEPSCIDGLCTDNKTAYIDQTNGFQLQYPDAWEVQNMSLSKSLIKANFNKDGQTGAQLRVETNVIVPLQVFINSSKQQFIKGMESHWQGDMQTLDEGSLYLSQETCVFIAYHFIRGDQKSYFFKHYFWKKDQTVYYFQAGTPYSERVKVEPLLDQMANSLQFI